MVYASHFFICISALIPTLLLLFFTQSINEGKTIELLANRGITIQDNNIFQWNDNESPLLIISKNISDFMLYFLSLFINFVIFIPLSSYSF